MNGNRGRARFARGMLLGTLAALIVTPVRGQEIPYWGYPEQGRWAIHGMALPGKILEKVYHKNAEKIFAMYRGEK